MEVEIDGIEEREEEREEIYSYLKCKICDGYFENAKILPSCFHSFCLVCISQSAECLTQENHFSIACEICNTITTTPSLSLLPNNSISEKLLKNFNPKNLQQNKVLSHSIEYCDNEICKKENKKASLYCDKCEANYCEECWKVVHSFGGIQKHSPLPILQKNNIKYCSTHLHKQMKFYCVPCDQLLCSLCFLDNHYINDRISKNHLVEPIDKAGEDIKKRMIKTSDQIALNRSSLDNRINEYEKKRNEINQSINEKKNNIQNLLREIELVKDDIEKLEIEKEIIKKKIKEDEENSTQIEISNRMIKDMIQSLPSILTTQKKYRDQIDHQISRVFESLYSFPLPQIDDLYILTDQEREECPTPQCQKEIMKKLEMKRPPLREGDVWYLIEYGWHQKWKRHVKYDWIYDINISPPDLIDNSNLLLPGTEILKQAVFENQDFIVSTYKEWKQLVSWYQSLFNDLHI